MSPRVPLVAGNWKMNTTVPDGVELAAAIMALDRPPGVEVAVLPPFPHLWPIHDLLKGSGIALGMLGRWLYRRRQMAGVEGIFIIETC